MIKSSEKKFNEKIIEDTKEAEKIIEEEGWDTIYHVEIPFKIGDDKKAHFCAAWAIVVSVFGLCACKHWSVALGFVIAIIIGIAKELYDKKKKGTGFDWGDLVSDILGAILGILVCVACIAIHG